MGKVLCFFTSRVPKFRRIEFLGGEAMSIRCGKFWCDTMTNKVGYHLIQYGRKGGVARFVCRISKEAEKPPMFMLSDNWKRFYSSKYLIAGETLSPISLSKLWR